ncbi:glycosyltransferase family 2 protein [Brevibacillus borstelensis]|uniref:glycosyltransferase family 2 protein n=1 Tax=Brevibacillus borstelensis TaxID=45462 RepID=UPI0030C059C2
MMEELVVWLLAAYGCSSLLVGLANFWIRRTTKDVPRTYKHYRLLLLNSGDVVEQAVRKLQFHSYLRGTPICISYQDDGSVDDTIRIMTVFERTDYLCREDREGTFGEPVMTIDLRQQGERERAL